MSKLARAESRSEPSFRALVALAYSTCAMAASPSATTATTATTTTTISRRVGVCLILDRTFACPVPYRATNSYVDRLGFGVGDAPVICPCSDVPETVPVTPLTDVGTLCALDPRPLHDHECARGAVGVDIDTTLAWRVSQIPLSPCPALLSDSRGPCGDSDATITYSPVCAMSAAPRPASASETSLADATPSTLVVPFVPPDSPLLDAEPDVGGGSAAMDVTTDVCTREEYESFSTGTTFACADRPCLFDRVVAVSASGSCVSDARSSDASRDADGQTIPVTSTSYVCEQDGTLSDESHGSVDCETGTIVRACSTDVDAAIDPAQRSKPAPGYGPCSPTTACGAVEERCPSERDGWDPTSPICPVPGRRGDGTACVATCIVRRPRFVRVEYACEAETCGSIGIREIAYLPCTLDEDPEESESSGACVERADAVNATVSCVSDPCPCADPGDCGPREGEKYDLIAMDGEVCESETLDVGGRCCESETLDACGLCAGEAYPGIGDLRVGLDARGICCSSRASTEDDSTTAERRVAAMPVLTRALQCCPSAADLDACGVCYGSGDTCSFEIALVDGLSDAQALRVASVMSRIVGGRVSWDGRANLIVEAGLGQPPELLASAYLRAISASVRSTPASYATAASSSTSVTVLPRGVAHNGVCEAGESLEDEAVCGLASRSCPALEPNPESGTFLGTPLAVCGGNGVCDHSVRECRCSYGYSGPSCGECAPGFTAFPVERRVRACMPTGARALAASASHSQTPVATIVLASVSAALVAVIVVTIATKAKAIIAIIRGTG